MADDVKVKFGGDFSEIDKDAQSASKRIGTALGAWVGDYAEGISGKLKSMFSVENLVGKFFENFTGAMDKMFEIENLSKKLGVGRKELQQFAKLGLEVGIDMETMGRSIQFANKTLGNLDKNAEARKTLLQFGYTTEQVNSRNIRAIDLIYKLAESYEKNKKALGDEVAQLELARQSTEFFGRAGQELNPIIKMGNEGLQERIRLMKVYSDEAIIGAAMTKRFIEAGEKKIKYYAGGRTAEWAGQEVVMNYVEDLEKKIKEEYKTQTGKEISQRELIKRMALRAKIEENMTPEELSLVENMISQKDKSPLSGKNIKGGFISGIMTSIFGPAIGGMLTNVVTKEERSPEKNTALALQEAFQDMAEQEKAKQKQNELLGQTSVMAASSLQQIGGGDVTSVMGVYNVADNIRRTAEATEKMAEQEKTPTVQTKITSVAK
jgi:hypothetical protein